MNHIDRYVGARLRRERVVLRRSLCEQAALLGIGVEALELFEIGAVRVDAGNLFRCCSSLGLSPVDFFGDLLTAFPSGCDGAADRSDA